VAGAGEGPVWFLGVGFWAAGLFFWVLVFGVRVRFFFPVRVGGVGRNFFKKAGPKT
jgi:hypothetical protein